METQTPDLQTVLERLEKLEEHNRRLKTQQRRARKLTLPVVVVLLLAIAVLTLVLPERHKTITARSLVIQDTKGHIRAFLGVFDDGRPRLTLQDDKGNPRAVLGVSEEGDASLRIYSEGGRLVWATPRSATMDEEIVPAVEDESAQDLTVEEE